MSTVLIVDDEVNIRESLSGVLSDEGHQTQSSEDAESALKYLKESLPDVVLLDIWMSGMDGLTALGEIKKLYPSLPVIMISGHGSVETAVKATKLGAYDFLEKPLSLEKVVLTVEHAIERKKLTEANTKFIQGEKDKYEMIGHAPVIEQLRGDIERAAPTTSWILITGENGTGKELVARNIHLSSERNDKPFVALNCAAIPEELIESELFGHEKGAFTSAIAKKKGRFDMADGGTLFLDEIGDMSLKTQAKVLRILQEQSFERVGGTKKIEVDVRVIAATNKDLKEEMANGNFREDLYYRLNVIPFHVPPLRERAVDIPVFVEHFLNVFINQTGSYEMKIDMKALDKLSSYAWPGNVRELKNIMERVVIMSKGNVIGVEDLPQYIRGEDSGGAGNAIFNGTLREARKNFEKEFISIKLKENGDNIAKTAEAIGVERSHLYRKVKDYKLI